MSHFKHLELRNHKGLKRAILNNLGKINVLCGPNNSGKTTALECIANPAKRLAGLYLTDDVVGALVSTPVQGVWMPSNLQMYTTSITESWGKGIWNRESGRAVLKDIQERFRQKIGVPFEIKQNEFLANFEQALDVRPEVVLIPAKRRLDAVAKVATEQRIEPDGSGVLNYLFYARSQDPASEIGNRLKTLNAGFKDITGGYDFDVFLKFDNQVDLCFRRVGGTFLAAENCGLGLRDLLIILYFAIASDFEIILIEEPENHLHPEIQRRLVGFLREHTSKQYFLSTHSSVFLNTQYADHVFTCRLNESVHVQEATSRANLLTDLGYSIADNLISDLVILCEGPKDKPVIEEFLKKMRISESNIVKVWPMGGDIMDQLDLTILKEANKLIALLDFDPGSRIVRKRFLKNCDDLKVDVFQLERYSIENYFSLAAISSVMSASIPASISKLIPNLKVSDQLGFDVKGNGGKIAQAMSLDDIKDTDLLKFFNKVSELLNP